MSKAETGKFYSLDETSKLPKEITFIKFDTSADIDIRLGIDPRRANQIVRDTVSLPHGIDREVHVLALCTPDKGAEAQEVGAGCVGLDECISRIKPGRTDINVTITTSSVMDKIGALGRVLGPYGLMPSPESGTVTNDLGAAIKGVKAGKIGFKVDKVDIIHTSVGKISFDPKQIRENAKEFVDTVLRLKPSSAKGIYIKSIYLSTAMSAGIRTDPKSAVSIIE